LEFTLLGYGDLIAATVTGFAHARLIAADERERRPANLILACVCGRLF
jgi:hypothetical protein